MCVCVCGWWKFLELGVISNHHYSSRGLWASHFSSENLDSPIDEPEMPQVPLGCLGTKWRWPARGRWCEAGLPAASPRVLADQDPCLAWQTDLIRGKGSSWARRPRPEAGMLQATLLSLGGASPPAVVQGYKNDRGPASSPASAGTWHLTAIASCDLQCGKP